MKSRLLLLATLLSATFFTACKQDEDSTPALVIPTAYDTTNFAANTGVEMGLGNQLAALTAEAQRGRNISNTVTASALSNLFTTGSPSLQASSTPYFASKLEGANGWMAQLALASGAAYTPGTPTGTDQGGVLGAYLFDENGLEMEQMIDKGLYGAVLYKHAATLLATPVVATSDKVMAVLGVSRAFANSNNATKHSRPDRQLGTYIARRDKNDGNGFYSQLKAGLIKLQAATKAGDAYKKEQSEAAATVRLAVEHANAATVINYCNAVITTLSQTTITDAQKGSALHAYGESVGFLHGWRTIPQTQKKITDAEIDAILVLLNAPYDGTPTSYTFVTDAANQLPKLQQVINRLKAIYGFSDAQLQDFKKNWVSEQNR